MTFLEFFNALLIVVGPWFVVGLMAIPALVQWPARPQPFRAARPARRPAYRRPAPVFGGAYA